MAKSAPTKRNLPEFQLWDGSWYRIGNVSHHQCCSCGLVHRVDHKFECGTIYERWVVDKKETAKARRKKPAK